MLTSNDSENSDVFIKHAKGKLKLFKTIKNFGLISPVWGPDIGQKLEEVWFFGSNSLPSATHPGIVVAFEVWENSEGKAQAHSVLVADSDRIDSTVAVARPQNAGKGGHISGADDEYRPHSHEPKMIYPSVYVSDIPMTYSEDVLRELHKTLGLNPDMIVGFKYLPSKLGKAGDGTGSVIVRYGNEEAAYAAVDRLKGHPIRLSTGAVKYVGARHAAPAVWMEERKAFEQLGRAPLQDRPRQRPAPPKPQRESWEDLGAKQQKDHFCQKIRGAVQRISSAGYGIIKHPEFGEVMWREYELPMDIRSMQFSDPARFQSSVQTQPQYQRLKEMDGQMVEAELYKLPDGSYRADNVKLLSEGTTSSARGSAGLSLEPLLPVEFHHAATASQPPPPSPPPPPPPSSINGVDYSRSNVQVPCSTSSVDAGFPTPPQGAADPSHPFYKTQPCPYHMQGMCPMGQGCFYAHSPDELRPPSQAMMMNPWAMTMGPAGLDKKHKEKKDKKHKKEKRDRGNRSNSECGKMRGWSDSEGEAETARGRKKPRQEFNNDDF